MEKLSRITIGDWTVVPARNLLERNGEVSKLEPRAMDLLVYLAMARDRVVSADELLREVWQGRVFDDGIVYKRINQLRKALGDDPHGPRFIETIPKRGYRLIAPVVVAETDSSSAPNGNDVSAGAAPDVGSVAQKAVRGKRLWPAVAATVAAAVVAAGGGWYFARPEQLPASSFTSLAVLPCENLSKDPEKEYARGIHEELVTHLSKMDFNLKARTAVMPYLDNPKPLSEIASELNVGAIMECSVEYAEGRIRVAVALVDASTSEIQWGERYDRELADIFAIQSDIARNVADALHAQLSPSQIAALEEVPSRSERAIENYYAAMRYEELGVVHWPDAATQYERAVAADPQFAVAYAKLALLRTLMFAMGLPPATADQVREAAEWAVRLRPDLVESRIAMIGYRFFVRGESVEQVLAELNPIEPEAARQEIFEFFGIRREIYTRMGQLEEALADATRAVELGPARAVPLLLYEARNYLLLGRYEEASRAFDHVADIAPDDWGTLNHRAGLPLRWRGDTSRLRALEAGVLEGRRPWPGETWLAAWMDGDYDVALRINERAPHPPPPHDWGWQLTRGVTHYTAGQIDAARPYLEAARDNAASLVSTAPTAERPNIQIGYATALSYLGAKEDAVRNTKEALASLEALSPGQARALRLYGVFTYASAGATDLAIAELETYLSRPGDWSIEGIQRWPHFDPIRDDPKFKDFIAKHAQQ